MGFPVYIVLPCFSIFWALIGIVGPIVVPRGPNQRVIRCMLMLIAVTCYLLWFIIYIAQMNPLQGTKLSHMKYLLLQREWWENSQQQQQDTEFN